MSVQHAESDPEGQSTAGVGSCMPSDVHITIACAASLVMVTPSATSFCHPVMHRLQHAPYDDSKATALGL